MAELLDALAQAIRQDKLCAVVTALDGPEIGRKLLVQRAPAQDGGGSEVASTGTLGCPTLDQAAIAHAEAAMEARNSRRVSISVEAHERDFLIDVHVPQEVLVIVGAVHIAIPLVTFARELGLRTIVVDARTIFATKDRFDHVDELIQLWPEDALQEITLNESTYVVTLTHDEKLDTPALICALNHPVGYVGALGSRRTHAKRVTALQAAGVSEVQIARIHAPIGLDLGARSPAEIALSIIAEIMQVRNRKGEAK